MTARPLLSLKPGPYPGPADTFRAQNLALILALAPFVLGRFYLAPGAGLPLALLIQALGFSLLVRLRPSGADRFSRRDLDPLAQTLGALALAGPAGPGAALLCGLGGAFCALWPGLQRRPGLAGAGLALGLGAALAQVCAGWGSFFAANWAAPEPVSVPAALPASAFLLPGVFGLFLFRRLSAAGFLMLLFGLAALAAAWFFQAGFWLRRLDLILPFWFVLLTAGAGRSRPAGSFRPALLWALTALAGGSRGLWAGLAMWGLAGIWPSRIWVFLAGLAAFLSGPENFWVSLAVWALGGIWQFRLRPAGGRKDAGCPLPASFPLPAPRPPEPAFSGAGDRLRPEPLPPASRPERLAVRLCRRDEGLVSLLAETPPPQTCRQGPSPWACPEGCLGWGDCVRACPRGAAIQESGRIPQTDPEKCLGCGACQAACPQGLIVLVPRSARVLLPCAGRTRRKVMLEMCLKGCLSCGLCRRACPAGALDRAGGGLFRVSQEACQLRPDCGEACLAACPRNVLLRLRNGRPVI
ncbi:MAG: 4Fe-4S binding protein [Deltaproteobacteria bacterium]|jgi:electron transport complex protein RnfB|nr:4Fe-4S binding protein [Deltaproteobacteria bacterium]